MEQDYINLAKPINDATIAIELFASKFDLRKEAERVKKMAAQDDGEDESQDSSDEDSSDEEEGAYYDQANLLYDEAPVYDKPQDDGNEAQDDGNEAQDDVESTSSAATTVSALGRQFGQLFPTPTRA